MIGVIFEINQFSPGILIRRRKIGYYSYHQIRLLGSFVLSVFLFIAISVCVCAWIISSCDKTQYGIKSTNIYLPFVLLFMFPELSFQNDN